MKDEFGQSERGDQSAPAGGVPRVWLLIGEKRGDNAQIRNLAKAVGWPVTEKSIVVEPKWREAKPPVRASLEHVDLSLSDPLEGPWPDLVLLAGRRLSSVGLWIKQASGGRTRLVVIGKPRGHLADFDLIVAAAHYCFSNSEESKTEILRHDFPLMELDQVALAEFKKEWVGRLTLLPRPLTALMIGGPTGGLQLDVDTARDLLEKTLAYVHKKRGSLYVTTSRRTPQAVADWLVEACSVNEQLYLYDSATPPEENPYQGLLALADDFVVTPDSLSMMLEVAQLGRPLQIHPLECEVGFLERGLQAAGLQRRLSPRLDPIPAGGVVARTLASLGWPIHSRDLTAIARRLVDRGLANWLGEPVVSSPGLSDRDYGTIAARVRSLGSR